MSWDEVKWVAKRPELDFLEFSENGHLDLSPPSLVASRRGIMYHLAAKTQSSWLNATEGTERFDIDISHSEMVKSFIGDSAMDGIGTEPLPLIDSIISVGFATLHDGKEQSEKLNDVDFHQYLQRLSLLSATTPSSNLRFNAHILTSMFLHEHPSPKTRFNFIRDTLQHCPYESLKVSAVGWLKDEILAAARPKESNQAAERPGDSKPDLASTQDDSAFFSAPTTLLDVCPLVFPAAVLRELDDAPAFLVQVPFFLASLNLLYLLCSSAVLRDQLDVPHMIGAIELDTSFITPLGHLRSVFKEVLLAEDGHGGDVGAALADMELLEDTLRRVRSAAFPE